MNTIEKEVEQHEKRNLIVFAANQIFMRLGWIFKTESVVMPGFLDVYTLSGFIRGLLPLISRIGQSIPQILIAHRVTKMPRKRMVFILSAFGITFPWLVLALTLEFGSWSNTTIVAIFLTLYGLHWLTYGSNVLAHGTLQGKLIRPRRRGRLLAYASLIGCTLAIIIVWLVMPRWVRGDTANYAWIFGMTGMFFGFAACSSLFFREPPDDHSAQTVPFLKYLSSGLMLLRYDRNFSYIRDSPDVVLHRLAHFSALYRFWKTNVRISVKKFCNVVDCTKHSQWTRRLGHGKYRRSARAIGL